MEGQLHPPRSQWDGRVSSDNNWPALGVHLTRDAPNRGQAASRPLQLKLRVAWVGHCSGGPRETRLGGRGVRRRPGLDVAAGARGREVGPLGRHGSLRSPLLLQPVLLQRVCKRANRGSGSSSSGVAKDRHRLGGLCGRDRAAGGLASVCYPHQRHRHGLGGPRRRGELCRVNRRGALRLLLLRGVLRRVAPRVLLLLLGLCNVDGPGNGLRANRVVGALCLGGASARIARVGRVVARVDPRR